jgi:RHS repeat-associated protein
MQNARQPYLTDSDIMELHYGPQDHLGSTRAVIQREGASVKVVEAMMYQAYGKMVSLAVQTDPVRMTFTTKEFDNESGMGLYYFGARYLDPEVGAWTSTDPKEVFWNDYSYGVNPISFIDPDGQGPVGAIIGCVIGAYVGASLASGSFNPAQWEFDDLDTYTGSLNGASAGMSIGNAAEDFVMLNMFGPGKFNLPKTAYGLRAMKRMYAPIIAGHKADAAATFTESQQELADNYQANRNTAANYNGTARKIDPAINDAFDKTEYFALKMGEPITDPLKHDNDMVNAFQHEYWQAKLTRTRGGSIARMYGNWHESTPKTAFNFNANNKIMDLGNNAIGRMSAGKPGNLYNIIENNMLTGYWFDISGSLVNPKLPFNWYW